MAEAGDHRRQERPVSIKAIAEQHAILGHQLSSLSLPVNLKAQADR